MRLLQLCLLFFFYLSGCSTVSKTPPVKSQPQPPLSGGGYYQDDGPGETPPPDLDAIPNAQPKFEPLHRFANRPYTVLGQSFTPMAESQPYKARGTASWYGKKFHGLKTASGEVYDMYGMTAAHPVLPIPSYVKVTHLKNGNSVVVRINDRGPFINNRIIDLSYTAAYKLRLLKAGSGPVEVEKIELSPSGEVSLAPLAAEFYLQFGAFASELAARNLADNLNKAFTSMSHLAQLKLQNGIYRVRVGPFVDRAQAEEVRQLLEPSSHISPLIVRE